MASLNDQIVAYLTVNNIAFTAGDYMTGQPEGQPDQILSWNTAKLGAEPTATQLSSAYTTYEGMQIQKQNKAQAMQLLADTDWTQHADVNNTAITPHLTNQAEFNTYRAAVRAIAVNPPTTPATFPVVPVDTWA